MDSTWFDTARLGLFVHWSHCSQRGLEVSWPLVGGLFALPYCSNVRVDEYHATAATFDAVKTASSIDSGCIRSCACLRMVLRS